MFAINEAEMAVSREASAAICMGVFGLMWLALIIWSRISAIRQVKRVQSITDEMQRSCAEQNARAEAIQRREMEILDRWESVIKHFDAAVDRLDTKK